MAEEKKKRKPYEVIAPMEDDTDISLQRSEERRVGKERWLPPCSGA